MNISKSLSIILAKNGIKGKDLAVALGVGPGAVSAWKNGRTSISGYMLDKLCEYLKMTKSEFFREGE